VSHALPAYPAACLVAETTCSRPGILSMFICVFALVMTQYQDLSSILYRHDIDQIL